ncbi:heterokaryon incompatibility protein-domain-containing protein [Tricladium varicosporioides]|nr:heterokaryon incompatibility protein-domain-containing protein [Hymenoscyphus varicosporioides]
MLCNLCAQLDFDKLFKIGPPIDPAPQNNELFPKSPNSTSWETYRAIKQTAHAYPHHPTYQSLIRSVENGCDLCSFILLEDITRRWSRTSFMRAGPGTCGNWESLRGAELMTMTEDGVIEISVPRDNIGGPMHPRGLWKIRMKEFEKPQIYCYIQYLIQDGDDEIEIENCDDSIAPVNLVFYQERSGTIPVQRMKTMHKADGYSFDSYTQDELLVRFPVAIDEGIPVLSDLIRNRPPVVHLKSPAGIAGIQNWLQMCEKYHPQCHTPPTAVLPTRVIDVGPKDGSQVPKLILTNGAKGSWVALSHCWGKVHIITTTTETITSMMEGISNLPPTFQDAVYLTRQLGLRYLWIDSLCILQDSKEDWMKESATMGRVYQDSYLSIQINAPDSSVSVLDEQFSETEWFRLPFQMQSVNGLTGCVYLGSNGNSEASKSSDVNYRAWCLQEYILSPRTVANSQSTTRSFIWSCRKGLATSRTPRPFEKWRWADQSYPGESLRWDFKSKFWNTSIEDSLQIYYALVSEYITRNITFPKDRLVAWSAVPREVAKRIKFQYVAGLWKEDIHRGLLWTCDNRDEGWRSGSDYIAPSWSWASVESKEEYEGSNRFKYGDGNAIYENVERNMLKEPDSGSLCKIVSVTASLAGSDSYGLLNSSELVITGKWQQSEKLNETHLPLIRTGDWIQLTEHGNGKRRSKEEVVAEWYLGFLEEDKRAILCDFDSKDRASRPGYMISNTFDLTVEQTRQYRDWSKISYIQIGKWTSDAIPNGTIWALILESGDNQVFRRVGVAQIADYIASGWDTKTITII